MRDFDDALRSEVTTFISGEHRHHRHTVDEFRTVATQDQLALYELLVGAERAGGQIPQLAPRVLATT